MRKLLASLLLLCCMIGARADVTGGSAPPMPVPSTGWACLGVGYPNLVATEVATCAESYLTTILNNPATWAGTTTYSQYYPTQAAYISYYDVQKSALWQSGETSGDMSHACTHLDGSAPPYWYNPVLTSQDPSNWNRGSLGHCTWTFYTSGGIYGPFTSIDNISINYYCSSGWSGAFPSSGAGPYSCTGPTLQCDAGDTFSGGVCHHTCQITGIDYDTVVPSTGGLFADFTIHVNPVRSCSDSTHPNVLIGTENANPFTYQCTGGAYAGTDGTGDHICVCPSGESWDGNACSAPFQSAMSTPQQYTPAAGQPAPLAFDDSTLVTAWATSASFSIVGQTTTDGSGDVFSTPIASAPVVYDTTTGSAVSLSWSHSQTTSNGVLVDHWSATAASGTLVSGRTYSVRIKGHGFITGTGVTVGTGPYTVQVQ